MSEWLAGLVFKCTGAAAGAGIAAWYRKTARRALQVVSAWWIGTVSSGWLMDFMAWPMTPDYLLMAGSAMGLMGFTILEALLSPATGRFIRSKMGGK